ncbi:hypothetical protein CL644_02470 [bacterium]|nr:hypothetical protein [bacterium]|tara:strand:+ start:4857 stop:6500 length:1644 start_codon:yes stop_codon:yes gene_type:complete
MNLSFDTINALIALATVANLLYGFLVYKRNSASASNIAFFLLTIAVTGWGVTMIIFRSTTTLEIALNASYWLYAAAAAIPTFFLLFTILFPSEKYILTSKHTAYIFIPFSLVLFSIFYPDLFVKTVIFETGKEHIIVFEPLLHIGYALYVSGMFFASYFVLIRKYTKNAGVLRSQVIYILIGALVPTFVGLFSNLLLPIIGEFRWNWMGQISIAVTTGIITYGILRHRLFNIRIIATEILIFIVWFIAFLRIIFSDTPSAVIFNTIAFLALVTVGFWLVRSVSREVDTREELEVLTKQLKKANDRLKELDRQKSEFLSIATHQLRGPLAGIRGHLSLIIDGSYGEISKKASEVIIKVFEASGTLAGTINDFLNVSRIEQGRMQYDKEHFSCSELVKDITEELQPVAQTRNLELEFIDKCRGTCGIYADKNKLRHIFTNLIDNAIKYTEKGWVKVTVYDDEKEENIRVEVADSGIGISESEKEELFQKFVRARGAAGVNVNGTGLGLYVARQMVEAHMGKIWAESEGDSKGSTFIVELPTATDTQETK